MVGFRRAGLKNASARHMPQEFSRKSSGKSGRESGRFAVVVPQLAAESLAALDLTGGAADLLARIGQSVVEGLVIALYVIMGQESDHGGTQRSLPEKDQALEALVL